MVKGIWQILVLVLHLAKAFVGEERIIDSLWRTGQNYLLAGSGCRLNVLIVFIT